MRKRYVIYTLCIMTLGALSLASCINGNRRNLIGNSADGYLPFEKLEVKYAKGFGLRYDGDVVLVDMQDPQDPKNFKRRYALVRKGGKTPVLPEGYELVETPVERVVCMTSLQLSNFIALHEQKRIAGVTSSRFLFDKELNSMIENGSIRRIGIEGNFDNEVLLSLDPDMIMISPFKRGGYDILKDTGIPLFIHLGYKEISPLGQAEWIKLIGLLTGEEHKADSLFNGIEQRYNGLVALTKDVQTRPVVFTGEMRGGSWYVVGGESYLANIFKDAGGDYFLKEDNSTGGKTLDFEQVYSGAANADFWRLLVSYDGEYSYEVLKQQDARYADFKAFQQGGIVVCNLQYKPYYEKSPVEPDLVLSDFIKALHPALLPNYKPVYYELLKR